MSNRKLTNIKVSVIDINSLLDDLSKEIEKNDGQPLDYKIISCGKHGMVKVNNQTYILDDEGIGIECPISEDMSYDLNLYKERGDGIELIPFAVYHIFDRTIPQLKIIKEIPLHEFIRTFGSRIEGNYDMWVNFFNKLGLE